MVIRSLFRFFRRPVDVAAYGAVGDGVTDDTAAINRAIAACRVGGTVLFPSGKTFRVRRINPASQWPGGIIARSGVTLSGYGATIYVDDDTNGIGNDGDRGGRQIVQAITAGQDFLVLDSAAGLDPKRPVWFCYNSIPTNPAEGSAYGYANIIRVEGNMVWLDRALPAAMSADDSVRWFEQPNILENATIEGLTFTANWNRGASIENASSVQFGRNLRFKDLTFTEPGSGAINLQYVDGASIEDIRILSACQDGGRMSKGRLLAFAETINVRISNVSGSNFKNCAFDIEAASRNLTFDGITLDDCYAGSAPRNSYWSTGDGCQFAADNVTISGVGYDEDGSRGTLVTENGPVDYSFGALTDRTTNGIFVDHSRVKTYIRAS